MSEMPVFGNDMTTITKVVKAFTFTQITPVTVAIRQIFLAQASYALPADRIVTLATMLIDRMIDEKVIKSTLTSLVRKGVLRSRTHQGKRLYEVNY